MPKTKQKAPLGVDEKLKIVLAHRLRAEVLIVLGDRTASPNELAAELGVTIQLLSHHIKVLRDDLELIELVDEVKRRGAVEHFYRAVHRDVVRNDEASKLSREDRRVHSAAIAHRQMLDIAAAIETDRMDSRPDRHLTRIPMHVDEQGFRDALEAYAELFSRLEEIQVESASRIGEERPAKTFHISAQQGCFEVPAPSRRDP